MSGERIRVGLIGCGRHSLRVIQPALRMAPMELVATCSRHSGGNAGVRHYAGHRQLLAAETGNLDACLVVLPAEEYAAVVPDLLAAGLPVWCEKPGAASAGEAADLQAAAERTGKPLLAGFNKRFATAYVMAKAAMQRPEFGRPTSYFGKFMMGDGYYPDEDAYLVDNPIHMLDLARHFMGEVESLRVERADWGGGRWTYAVTLRFAGGAVGLLHFGTTQSWQQHNELVEITGEGSSLTVDNVVRFQYRSADGSGESWEPNFTVPVERNHTLALAGYVGELTHFADVVRLGVPPQVTIADAQRALELVEQILDAGRLQP